MPAPHDVPIRDESIRLGQFLKLADLVESGAEAKPVVVEGRVSVNGEVDTRRGRQLKVGDVVALHHEPGGAVAAAARVAPRVAACCFIALAAPAMRPPPPIGMTTVSMSGACSSISNPSVP